MIVLQCNYYHYITQGPDNTAEISSVTPEGPASRSQLRVGFQILSVNSHRIRSAKKCAEIFRYYTAKRSGVSILASGGALPTGCTYTLVKKEKQKPMVPAIFGDGSLQGLFLKEERGMVRVQDIGSNGYFSCAKIKKGDFIMAIDGHEVHSVKECEDALEHVSKDVVVIVTYNVLRRVKSSIVVRQASNEAIKSASENSNEPLMAISRVVGDIYEMGNEVRFSLSWVHSFQND